MAYTTEQRRINGSKGGKKRQGKKSPRTIDREAMHMALKDRGANMAQMLLSSQTLLAMGTHTLIRIDKVGKKEVFTVVTDSDEITKVFNTFGEVDGSGIVDEKYYFVTHKEPQNQAIDSIQNRTFGRPTESIEIGNKDNQPFILNLKK